VAKRLSAKEVPDPCLYGCQPEGHQIDPVQVARRAIPRHLQPIFVVVSAQYFVVRKAEPGTKREAIERRNEFRSSKSPTIVDHTTGRTESILISITQPNPPRFNS
jgi:hypothetical protein